MFSFRRFLSFGVHQLSKACCKQKSYAEQFNSIAKTNLQQSSMVLDAGCGRTARVLVQGDCRMLVGVDIEKPVNETVEGFDEIVMGDLASLPFASKIFDVITSWMVIEHLENPAACFNELNRVCRDGGTLVVATPNILHYAVFMTRMTPYWFHEWFRKCIINSPEKSHETVYKANTPGRLKKMMNSAFNDIWQESNSNIACGITHYATKDEIMMGRIGPTSFHSERVERWFSFRFDTAELVYYSTEEAFKAACEEFGLMGKPELRSVREHYYED